MSKIENLEEFRTVVELATAFLLCGTIYGTVPYEKVGQVREKNRRLGLGMMGLHEWMLTRGYHYGMSTELQQWLEVYAGSGYYANKYADQLSVSRPVKTRSIAPAGTISIISETTSGCEPIFCAAFKRRYLKGNTWYSQYVIDSAAQRLIEKGVPVDKIEDAYTLANDVERRISFQAFLQRYVDHAISSTINLPAWGSAGNNQDTVKRFGEILYTYLPELRGITTYPDGARGGQPLVPVPYAEAKDWLGVEFEEFGNSHSCTNGACGI